MIPTRKRDSWAAMLLAVADAFPCTNSFSGMYMKRTRLAADAKMYSSPATLAFLLSAVMGPPECDVSTGYEKPWAKVQVVARNQGTSGLPALTLRRCPR